MYCQEVSEKLNQFVDGELSPFEALVVQRHLGDCPRCDRHLSELQLVGRALSFRFISLREVARGYDTPCSPAPAEDGQTTRPFFWDSSGPLSETWIDSLLCAAFRRCPSLSSCFSCWRLSCLGFPFNTGLSPFMQPSWTLPPLPADHPCWSRCSSQTRVLTNWLTQPGRSPTRILSL